MIEDPNDKSRLALELAKSQDVHPQLSPEREKRSGDRADWGGGEFLQDSSSHGRSFDFMPRELIQTIGDWVLFLGFLIFLKRSPPASQPTVRIFPIEETSRRMVTHKQTEFGESRHVFSGQHGRHRFGHSFPQKGAFFGGGEGCMQMA
jgi:hypothetical protein